jgi:DNA-binding CsgD family transcriptional regulator
MQPCDRLTAKETQVAMLVWEGQTNREIANAVGTTEQVIKNYLRNTFDKLGVWSRLELALYVAAHGGARWRAPAELLPLPASLTGDSSRSLQSAAQSVQVRIKQG